MLPFGRMLSYGNIKPVPRAIKVDSIGMGNDSNMAGNWLGAILTESGDLYGMGSTKIVSFGVAPKNGMGLQLVRQNIKNFWLLPNGVLVLQKDGEYFFCGAYALGIFSNAAQLAPFRSAGFVNVSSYFTSVGEVVDAVCVGGYDKGPATNPNPVYGSKYKAVLTVLNNVGEVFYIGSQEMGLINGQISYDTYQPVFVKDNQLTQKATSLRGTITMSHRDTYYIDGRPVLYCKLEDGTIMGKGYNIRYGIASSAIANQLFNTWQTVVPGSTANLYDFDASNEGMLYCANNQIYRCGAGGGYSYYNGRDFFYYYSYNVGMGNAGPNDVNSVSGSFNLVTTGILNGQTINLPSRDDTKIRMNFCGSVLFRMGRTDIYVSHGVYSDYYATPSWTAGAVPYFTNEDTGIPISDAMYVGGTINSYINPDDLCYGLVVIGMDGKVYWRGKYGTEMFSTLTEIPLS